MYFAVFSRDNFKSPQKFLIGGKLKMTANVKIAAKSTLPACPVGDWLHTENCLKTKSTGFYSDAS